MKAKLNALTKGGVLLMGRDLEFQRSMQAVLQAENYETVSVASRDEAEELLEQGSIDILVMDMDSLTASAGPLLTQFRAKRPQLRVIALVEPRNGAIADLAGVNVWMKKPLQPSQFVATVNGLLASLRAEVFCEKLLRRRDAPFFSAVSCRDWGINE